MLKTFGATHPYSLISLILALIFIPLFLSAQNKIKIQKFENAIAFHNRSRIVLCYQIAIGLILWLFQGI